MKQNVNYILHHKNANYKLMELNVSSTHMSLYNALFLLWNNCGFDTKMSINRTDVMNIAKIGSNNTYVKCLKELDKLGVIKYKPSHNPMIGSVVSLCRFDTSTDIVQEKFCTTTESTTGATTESTTGATTESSIATLSKQLNNKTYKQLNERERNSLNSFFKKLKDYLPKADTSILENKSNNELTPFQLIEKEKPSELETWKMQNLKQVGKDFKDLVEKFNNTCGIEILSNQKPLEMNSDMLIYRFRNFAGAWISNSAKNNPTPEANSYESGKKPRI